MIRIIVFRAPYWVPLFWEITKFLGHSSPILNWSVSFLVHVVLEVHGWLHNEGSLGCVSKNMNCFSWTARVNL